MNNETRVDAMRVAAMDISKIRQAQIEAGEKAVIDSLPAILKVSPEEFQRRMSAPYVWPTNEHGQRLPRGDCSSCRQTDKQAPEGRACDYGCVGV